MIIAVRASSIEISPHQGNKYSWKLELFNTDF